MKRTQQTKDNEIAELRKQILGIVQEFDVQQLHKDSDLERRVKEAERRIVEMNNASEVQTDQMYNSMIRLVLQIAQLRSQSEMIDALNNEINEKMDVAA